MKTSLSHLGLEQYHKRCLRYAWENTMIGMFAISQAGHDKGQIYVIINEDDEYVYLADGHQKLIENPKKKKRKHIQPVKKGIDEALKSKLLNRQLIYNEEIKYAIKSRT